MAGGHGVGRAVGVKAVRGELRRAMGHAAWAALGCLLLAGGAALATSDGIPDPEARAAAARSIERRLAESRERHGAESRYYADTIAVSLEGLIAAGRAGEAARLARKALAIYRKAGPLRGLYFHAMDQLAEALLRLGHTEERVEVLSEKVALLRARGAFDHLGVARLYYALERLGRYREAEALRREEIAAVRNRSDPDFRSDPRAMKHAMRHDEPRLLSELAVLVAQQGRYDEAGRLHAEAVEMARTIFGDGAPAWKVVQAHGRFLVEHGEGPEDAATLAGLRAAFPRLFPR